VTRPRYSAQTLAVLARAMAPEDAAAFLAANAPKDPAAVAVGAEAHEHGASLERWLSAQHDVARAAGLANIRKAGPPVRVGRDGRPCEWAGRGPADYLGALRGGRATLLEAKSRPARLTRAEIPAHQQEDLSRGTDLGALALLVVELRDTGKVYAVEWARVPWRVTKATVRGVVQVRETVGHDELVGCEVPSDAIYLRRWFQ